MSLHDASMDVNGRSEMRTRMELAVTSLDECCPAVLSTPLTEARAEELAMAFAVLADPVRIRLLSLVVSAESGEACVCELVEPLGRSQPTVSHHLKVLREAGLVSGTRRGTNIWYAVVPTQLDALRQVLSPSA